MTGDVTINIDADAAAVLLDWLQREEAIDGFKWAASRAGDRVALRRALEATRVSVAETDPTAARERLESTLPPDREHQKLREALQHAPEHIRRRLEFMPSDHDLVSRVSQRLDVLGVRSTGVGWENDGEHGYLEVGLDPYSEDTARRIRLMCEPVEVRFIEGPRRPGSWRFGPGADAD